MFGNGLEWGEMVGNGGEWLGMLWNSGEWLDIGRKKGICLKWCKMVGNGYVLQHTGLHRSLSVGSAKHFKRGPHQCLFAEELTRGRVGLSTDDELWLDAEGQAPREEEACGSGP